MAFDSSKLFDALERILGSFEDADFCVAFSGGLDSTVLLAALADLGPGLRRERIRAIHVNHGLYPEAPAWSRAAESTAANLGLPIDVRTVEVAVGRGESVEARAREARYRLLADELRPGEVLLTAHHQDDQLETVVLQLMRGSGLPGLAAMPERAGFGRGWHVRPLLAFGRDELEEYGRGHGLVWQEDPSNDDRRFDRNYVRHEVVPRLKARWPSAGASVRRSAMHCAEAARLLKDLAASDGRGVLQEDGLDLVGFRKLDRPRQANLLRFWISGRGFPTPSTRKLGSILRDAVEAREDASPCVSWPGAELRRYRDRLYLMAPGPEVAVDQECWDWSLEAPLVLGPGLGELHARPAAGAGLSAARLTGQAVVVKLRSGGEKIRPAGSPHTRALRNLFQDAGILPWVRSRIPLLYLAGRLVAVAGLWYDDEYRAAPGEPGVCIEWRDGPRLC